MTKNKLKQLYYLKKELIRWEEQLSNIKDSSYLSNNGLTGMPRGSDTSDVVASKAIKKIKVEEKIRILLLRCELEKDMIWSYIINIDDSLIRQIIMMRYIDLMSWKQIANEIGGGNTPDGIRMLHDRYINSSL